MPDQEDQQKNPMEKLSNQAEVKNIPQPDLMFAFDGTWMLSKDAGLIGPSNFQKLINMRYIDGGIEGVTGYTEVNTTPITTYINIKTGIHLRTDERTKKDYVLIQAQDSSGNGHIYDNQTSIGEQGEFTLDFDNEPNKIVDDYGLDAKEFSDFTPNESSITPNAGIAPDGTRTAVKLVESATANIYHELEIFDRAITDDTYYTYSIFAKPIGDRHGIYIRIQEFDQDDEWFRVVVDLVNGTFETNKSTGDEVTYLNATMVAYPDGWYNIQMTAKFENTPNDSIDMTIISMNDIGEIRYDGDGVSGIYIWGAKITESSSFECFPEILHTDVSTNLNGRFSRAPAGNIAYANGEEIVIWGGEESTIGSVFTTTTSAEALPVDVTEKLINSRDDSSQRITFDQSTRPCWTILTTRPAKGFKFYIQSANVSTSTLTCKDWSGTAYAAVSNPTDNTSNGGIALAQTGTFTFDDTISSAKLHHFEERYLYAYQFELSAGSAVIYEVTANFGMQTPTNIWDGIYRQPIQAQVYTHADTAYEDFSLHVSESSTVSIPVGCILDAFVATNDKLILMFEEKMAGIKCVMLGNLINIIASNLTLKYWDGDTYITVGATLEDGTAAGGTKTFGQSGLISWTPPSDEEKTTLFGTSGYAYEITVSTTLTGAKGTDEDVVIDIISGIPAQQNIETYTFPIQYKNKLMLAGYTQGNEGNRVDYSEDNAPDIFNGENTSLAGYQSLYFGGTENLTAGAQLYNRFGSNLFSSLVLFKVNELYLLTGDGPLDYRIFPISFTIGCPAPNTLATAEVGFELSEDVARNIAMWVSNAGPMMFDGAVLKPMEGIEKYFDPNESISVNFDYLDIAQGWFDSTYKEYNILLPTGVSQTTLNTWLVYDIVRKKWFQKDVGTGNPIQCAFSTTASNGNQYMYAGSLVGTLYQLENGASWTGASIVNTIQTGDFFPSKNEWDITRVRRLKFVSKRVTESGATVDFYYTSDTDDSGGLSVTYRDVSTILSNSGNAGVSFVDVTSALADSGNAGVIYTSQAANTLDLSVTSGLNRIIRSTLSMNQTAWCHSFKFEFTSSQTEKGMVPIMWGIQFEVVRKDHEDL